MLVNPIATQQLSCVVCGFGNWFLTKGIRIESVHCRYDKNMLNKIYDWIVDEVGALEQNLILKTHILVLTKNMQSF